MNKVLWVDLETTGLDPQACRILEVSAVVTDTQFQELDTFSQVIHCHPGEIWPEMNDFCRYTHQKSGLLDECEKSILTLADVETMFYQFVSRQFSDTKPLLTGSTVTFDQAFIRRHMPVVASLFHYRTQDVSGFQEILTTFLQLSIPRAQSVKHRGLDDIRDSIDLLRRCLKSLQG